ncbi:V-type ATP synthase subunit I [Hutsoniella sourekii]|uniref:V-type ATP synthase subunit I n=1 Tax=Hutsoniella sourekii TaxID=87650 RepID=UPI0009FB9673|nr:V-type ATP synthase subunit I [Hutsoniella sourekii]
MEKNQFTPFTYSYQELPQERLKIYQKEIENFKVEYQEIFKRLESSREELDQLKLAYEYVSNLNKREQIKLLLGYSKHLISIQGWIEADQAQDFIAQIRNNFSQNVIIAANELTEVEAKYAPTKLRNNWLVRPFEMITNMYGVPNYQEIDPTPFVMPFYSLFFGMMIGDLGYGLLIMLATLIPILTFNLSESTKQVLKLANTLGWSAILWGIIYGSFFGITLPQIQIINLEGQVMEVMMLSLAIGVLHMLIAFALNTYLHFRNKAYALGFAEGLGWIVIILGLLIYGLGQFVPMLAPIAGVGGWFALFSLAGIFVAHIIETGSISGLGKGLLSLIDGVSYFGDVISYSRLMALGLSGVSIGAAFNLIVGQLPPVARFSIGILIFLGLHLFNLFLSFLTGAVHALRLIFVEFFGKFYSGNGHLFEPFASEEKYVEIKKSK